MISRDKPMASSSTPADPRRALLDRILASRAFAKSERLSSLLAYVCEMSLAGRAGEINEQRIGEAVFGRSKDYDSAIDGIVRTQASRLRQKLDAYFSEEGRNEPIRIVIARGGYVPAFEPRTARHIEEPASFGEPVATSDPPSQPPNTGDGTVNGNGNSDRRSAARLSGSHTGLLAWSLVALLGCVLIAVLAVAARLDWQSRVSPASAAGSAGSPQALKDPLWSQLFGPQHSTLVVFADSGLVMWQGVTGRSIGLSEYLSGDYRRTGSAKTVLNEASATQLANMRYTSVVDLEITQALLPLAQAEKGSLDLRYARDIRPNALKQGNIILLGAAEATPWVELFERNMNFVFYNNRQTRTFSVLNRAPRPGEPSAWQSAASDTEHRVYGVVAFLPNLSGDGNALILEGTSMAGTECAWDFVSDTGQLQTLLDRIRRPDGTLPHFELVLGTNNLSGSSGKNSILAWRIVN